MAAINQNKRKLEKMVYVEFLFGGANHFIWWGNARPTLPPCSYATVYSRPLWPSSNLNVEDLLRPKGLVHENDALNMANPPYTVWVHSKTCE